MTEHAKNKNAGQGRFSQMPQHKRLLGVWWVLNMLVLGALAAYVLRVLALS
ncbi:hypothetical protein JM93_01099 [Roseibium hamelinense]|uniref:Uncharacterized protein n=1 Tax=Roseibium hamelinense TaxID=150831 RepID=A0A562T9A9_9HYPH|nr:hypothetical protein [Roseibium hamelinense]TWI90122.1 hypothetical protein JM93_01099 [Roseibium hamelinense]